ncbi:MAG: heme lyase CcmF/NrfE family subunit [Nitrospirae bacterium]|nr:heme lyase CcmF/NrfE family subunit [Nitrospirota bacterium]
MTDLGHFALLLTIPLAAFGILASVFGQIRHRPEFIVAAHRALFATAGTLTLAMVALTGAFLLRDFSVSFVAGHSSAQMPWYYTFAALWGGQEGSLLLWVWVQSLYGTFSILATRRKLPELAGTASAIFCLIILFFSVTLAFAGNPFARLFPVPTDGGGLNPLLQHPLMVIHPPMLYAGLIGTSVPFAFAMAALVHRRMDPLWIHLSRKWALFCWICLTTGVVLGGFWAYVELGWGGYWAWDPVENASFMPWLTLTAYFHSTMVQERRRLLAGWNIVLIILTYALTLFGTFLTRSGVISSVHSFALSNIGPFFLSFVSVLSVASFMLLIVQRPKMRGPVEEQIEHPVSRESSMLINNLFLLSSAFVVFWGTIFPVVTEAIRGTKISVGAPFFNTALGPVGLVLLGLMGIAQMIPWRKTSAGRFSRNVGIPLLAGAAAGAGAWMFKPLVPFALGVGFSGFVVAGLVWELIVSTRARRRLHGEPPLDAAIGVVTRQRRRVGGFVSHVGSAVLALGIMGSFFNTEEEKHLKPGADMQVKNYSIRFERLDRDHGPNYFAYRGVLAVQRDGAPLGAMSPERRIYPNQNEPTTEVALRQFPSEDLYVVLADYDKAGEWVVLKVFVKPLVSLVWLGWLILVSGALWAFTGRSLAVSAREPGAGAA